MCVIEAGDQMKGPSSLKDQRREKEFDARSGQGAMKATWLRAGLPDVPPNLKEQGLSETRRCGNEAKGGLSMRTMRLSAAKRA